MDLTRDSLTIPNPRPGELRLKYDLSLVSYAEDRIEEIAFVTPHKGPELLATFSKALRELSRHLAHLHYQCSVASKKRRHRRAVVVIDVVPTVLAEKKLTNNETNREAIVELDPEFSAVCDVEGEVEAAYVFIREKYRTLESCLNAVKKSMDASSSMLNFIPNHDLVQVPGQQPQTKTPGGMAIGSGKYQ